MRKWHPAAPRRPPRDIAARIARATEQVIGIDEQISRLATVQHGIVTRQQLVSVGISDKAIRHRLATGRLIRIHRGVYAVGHGALTDRSRWTAAVLAVDPGSLSHFSAGAAAGFVPLGGPIHVSTEGRRRVPGLIVHRCLIQPQDLIEIDCISSTSVELALLDLASIVPENQVRSFVREARFQELTNLDRLAATLDRYPNRRGRRKLLTVVEQMGFGTGVTRGVLEGLFADFLLERGLPEPEFNVEIWVEGHRFVLDCLWPAAGLVVELDGREAHSAGDRHDRDTWRDRKLLVTGLETVRVTWRQLVEAPDELERDIRAALARRETWQPTALQGQ